MRCKMRPLGDRTFRGRKRGIYQSMMNPFSATALNDSLPEKGERRRGFPAVEADPISKDSVQRKTRVSSHQIAASDIVH